MDGVTLNGIEKRFGSVTAVTDINLDLPQGKFISFLGPSGCGKTTLLRLIAGLEVPTRARYRSKEKTLLELPPTSETLVWCSSRWPCFRT